MELEVINLGINGEGVVKVGDKIGFVDYALPNETIDAEIVKENKKFINLKLNKVIKSSDERIMAICPYYFSCGGCDLMHLKYENTLEYKKEWVKNTFFKNAKIKLNIDEIKYYKDNIKYRNKGVFPICINDNGCGFGHFKKKSNFIIETENCLIMNEEINKILFFCNTEIKNLSLNFAYNFVTKTGFLKYLVVRSINNVSLITFVLNCHSISDLPSALLNFIKNLSVKLSQDFDCGVFLNFNTNNNQILSNNFHKLLGKSSLEDEFNGIKYSLDPYSFLQVNNEIRNMLYNEVLRNIDENATVIDGYSGAGLLTAILSKKAKYVFGVEIVKPAVESANLLVEKNWITNVINICGDSAIEIPKIFLELNKFSQQNPQTYLRTNKISKHRDMPAIEGKMMLQEKKSFYQNNNGFTLVLDPPRSGVDSKLLEKCLSPNINKIIYISCDYSTCARDVNYLKEYFNIEKCTLFDMFPQTANIETLLILTRKQN